MHMQVRINVAIRALLKGKWSLQMQALLTQV